MTRKTPKTPDTTPAEPEIVTCPYCGRLAPEDQVERPADYCHHDVVDPTTPAEPEIKHAHPTLAKLELPAIERHAHELLVRLARGGFAVDPKAARFLLVTGYVSALEVLGRPDLADKLREHFKL